MKIEALNCPNCGAGVASDKTLCQFCHSRLKTIACPSCFGLMFSGSKFCVHCGAKAVEPQISQENSGECPRCKIKLNALQISGINLRECGRCGGLWTSAEIFENLCADNAKQAAVLGFTAQNNHSAAQKIPINYVPCPDCKQLMNRNNFARSSGVIIDICKQHGVWFDAEELPRIIEFIRKGGLDHARQKEKIHLEEQRKMLVEQERKAARENARFYRNDSDLDFNSTVAIREFVRFLFD